MTGTSRVRLIGSVGLLSAALFSVGCATARVAGTEGVDAGLAVAILSWQHSDMERRAATCIAEAVQAAHPTLRIVSTDEFRRTVFAYGSPEDPAGRAKYFETLVSEPVVRERMASLGIRHLVYLAEARTEQGPGGGFGGCGGGPGGAGCFGAIWWERSSRLVASVVDIQAARAMGDVSASATGTPVLLGLLVPIPIPIPAFTETRACGELGEAVTRFLQGDAARPEPKGTAE
jgi:hypothetical protein